jgi:hypothetical protein
VERRCRLSSAVGPKQYVPTADERAFENRGLSVSWLAAGMHSLAIAYCCTTS